MRWYEVEPGVINIPLKRRTDGDMEKKSAIANEIVRTIMDDYMVGIIQWEYEIEKKLKKDSSFVMPGYEI